MENTIEKDIDFIVIQEANSDEFAQKIIEKLTLGFVIINSFYETIEGRIPLYIAYMMKNPHVFQHIIEDVRETMFFNRDHLT